MGKMKVEMIDNFFARTYFCFPTGKVIVWKTPQLKEELGKSEMWEMKDAENYIAWLENNQQDNEGKE